MVNLPMAQAINKELRIETVFRYRLMYPLAIEAVAAGKVNLKDIVTDYFDFDDIINAMARSAADKENIVKAVVRMG
jgi:L-iditol 2-dehydrogenase